MNDVKLDQAVTANMPQPEGTSVLENASMSPAAEVSDILSPVITHLHDRLEKAGNQQEVSEVRRELNQYLIRLQVADQNVDIRAGDLYRQEAQAGSPHGGKEFKSQLDPTEFKGKPDDAFDAVMQELRDAVQTAETSGEMNSIRTVIAGYMARLRIVDIEAGDRAFETWQKESSR